MQKLTFHGFLKRYIVQLSQCGSSSIYKLVRECVESNPRLREPLYLYAAAYDHTDTLLRATRGTNLYKHYQALAERYSYSDMVSLLKTESVALDEGYHKVWQAYQSVLARKERDDRVKELYRGEILRLHQETGVSVYRAGKDNRLNNGNYSAWIRTGDSNKISLEAAKRVYTYLGGQ
ncbi:MAG: transcriptional regulator [Oscillospiraceae bacterium]|nr:transcriptional regulator [Oscillospiraceae bacterium]